MSENISNTESVEQLRPETLSQLLEQLGLPETDRQLAIRDQIVTAAEADNKPVIGPLMGEYLDIGQELADATRGEEGEKARLGFAISSAMMLESARQPIGYREALRDAREAAKPLMDLRINDPELRRPFVAAVRVLTTAIDKIPEDWSLPVLDTSSNQPPLPEE